jgi:hypothetical protein
VETKPKEAAMTSVHASRLLFFALAVLLVPPAAQARQIRVSLGSGGMGRYGGSSSGACVSRAGDPGPYTFYSPVELRHFAVYFVNAFVGGTPILVTIADPSGSGGPSWNGGSLVYDTGAHAWNASGHGSYLRVWLDFHQTASGGVCRHGGVGTLIYAGKGAEEITHGYHCGVSGCDADLCMVTGLSKTTTPGTDGRMVGVDSGRYWIEGGDIVIEVDDCMPGQAESRACCDCGTQSRTCGADSHWGPWGACAGPDPDGGGRSCETGECGPCSEGRVRCIDGCLACVSAYEPTAELCDVLDNDCNCTVNDGSPTQMGDVPPPYAARLADSAFPGVLAAGETGRAWVEFVNVGTETWKEGEIWLGAQAALDGSGSDLFVEASWPSWDVAAVLAQDVPPGGVGRFEYAMKAPETNDGRARESFILIDAAGDLMACPDVDVEVDIAVEREEGVQDHGQTEAPPGEVMEGGCACAVATR